MSCKEILESSYKADGLGLKFQSIKVYSPRISSKPHALETVHWTDNASLAASLPFIFLK